MKHFTILLAIFLLPFTGKLTAQEIYVHVEEMPKFTQGNPKDYLIQHMRYPKSAIKNNIIGRVYVKFVIDTLGNVINPIILRGVSSDLDGEALRLIGTTSGKWKPGRLRDKPQFVEYIQAINFRLPHADFRGNMKTIRTFIKEAYSDRSISFPHFITDSPWKDIGEYLKNNLQYPPTAKQNNITGEVHLNFVIDTLGQIIKPLVTHSIHPLLDAEALRVLLSTSGQWKPGKNKGKKVSMPGEAYVKFEIPQPCNDIIIDY